MHGSTPSHHGSTPSHHGSTPSHRWERRSHRWERTLPSALPSALPCMGACAPMHGSSAPMAWERALPWHGSRSKAWEKRSHGEQIWERFWTRSHAWEGVLP